MYILEASLFLSNSLISKYRVTIYLNIPILEKMHKENSVIPPEQIFKIYFEIYFPNLDWRHRYTVLQLKFIVRC